MSLYPPQLGDVATWFNAMAMASAAVFAWLAWRAQVEDRESREYESRREAAVRHAAAAIEDLTTGSVASARRCVADKATSGGVPDTVGSGDEELRHQVFVLLWALHRLEPLADDLGLAKSGQRQVLGTHIGLITASLRKFAGLLPEGSRAPFATSAEAAKTALADLSNVLDVENDSWKTGLE
ncbi:hypothetical protein L5G28_08490 [Gordonia sp. HY285]|uniref:hypothetical protein n=1 Tax=Gordonia liuliyuniae TaxID=2911517 RepID=UPI001F2ACA59|nr:hypothetical protein [Gordonia liuliyuniae]MCF8610195.1 hypothetical protein [Gordonia liuliyuniae]